MTVENLLFSQDTLSEEKKKEDDDLYTRDHEKNLFFSFLLKTHIPNLYARYVKIFVQFLDKEKRKNSYPNMDKRERDMVLTTNSWLLVRKKG